MAEKNIIRQDIIQIKWNVQDFPLKKIAKESDAFQSSVGKAVKATESKFGSLTKSVQSTQKQLKQLKLSDRLQSDINRADNALNRVKNTACAAVAQITKMRLQAMFAVGALQTLAKQKFLALKASLSAVWLAISNIVPKAKAFVVLLKDVAKQKITNTVNEWNRVKNVLTEGKAGAKGFAAALKNIGKISLGKAVKGITNVKNGFSNAKSTVKGFALNIKGDVQNGFRAAVNQGKQLVQTIKNIDGASLRKITESITKLGVKIGSGLVSDIKKAVSAIKKIGMAAGAGFAALATASVKGYGDYEQLVGGVETLFKDSSGTVVHYANDAYKTAGLSANNYMETITGFSASLLQGLGGDTKKAAEVGNRAVIDMSDNANKMGTDMESIQNAYQGFAKQNYTMLDNLKLGYGGTQEEMKRLIQDAAKAKDMQKELGVSVDASSMSFANIINAISVVQKKLDITGTTAKEASTTIQGSVNSMKAAWSNFLTGMADPDQDFGQLVDNLVDSIVTVAQNLIPRIKMTMPRLAQGVGQLFSQLFTLAVQNVDALGPLAPIVRQIIGAITTLKAKFQDFATDQEKMASIENIFAAIRTTIANLVPIMQTVVDAVWNFVTSTDALDAIKAVFSGISEMVAFVREHFEAVKEIVISVAGAFGVFMIAVKIISAVIAVIRVFKTMMVIANAAQLGFNSALLACPVAWIVAAIIGLIAVIILLVRNWDKVKAAAGKCWDAIRAKWAGVSSWFSSNVIQPVKQFFADVWEKIPAPVQDVISKIVGGFKKAYDGVTDCWSGISGYFSNLLEGVVNTVAKPVNKLIDGANWVLGKVGSSKRFDSWKPYATGTGGHPGGHAIVNDGRGAELVQMPNGMTFIPQGRNVGIPNAPKGMKVLDAQRTAQLMGKTSPTFHYRADSGRWMNDIRNICRPMSDFRSSVNKGVSYAGGVGTIQLPAYTPAASVPVSGSSTTSNNYAPSFTLNLSGTVDRTTERTVKKWVREAMEEMFDSMSRTNPRLTEV